MESTVVAQGQGISFAYKSRPLFSDLGFTLESGNIYGLLGKNGAGKSTLLKILSGQLFARSGSLKVLGSDPSKREAKLLGEIFYLNEEFSLPRMHSHHYCAMLAPFYRRFDQRAFVSYAKEFELDLSQRLDQMSLGQKKKYLLCFGLASNTRLVIMDEPTNGLDIPSKRQFRQIVARAMSEERTFIISTHQVRDMEGLIDPIIILEQGQVIFNDRLDTVGDRYVIERTSAEPEGEVLYKERLLGGWMVLKERSAAPGGQNLDLETLFNILVAKGGRI